MNRGLGLASCLFALCVDLTFEFKSSGPLHLLQHRAASTSHRVSERREGSFLLLTALALSLSLHALHTHRREPPHKSQLVIASQLILLHHDQSNILPCSSLLADDKRSGNFGNRVVFRWWSSSYPIWFVQFSLHVRVRHQRICFGRRRSLWTH